MKNALYVVSLLNFLFLLLISVFSYVFSGVIIFRVSVFYFVDFLFLVYIVLLTLSVIHVIYNKNKGNKFNRLRVLTFLGISLLNVIAFLFSYLVRAIILSV